MESQTAPYTLVSLTIQPWSESGKRKISVVNGLVVVKMEMKVAKFKDLGLGDMTLQEFAQFMRDNPEAQKIFNEELQAEINREVVRQIADKVRVK